MKYSHRPKKYNDVVFYKMYFTKTGARLIETSPADANVIVTGEGEIWLPRDYTPRLVNSEPIPQTCQKTGAKRLVIKQNNEIKSVSFFRILMLAFGNEDIILEKQPDIYKKYYLMMSAIQSKSKIEFRIDKYKSVNGYKSKKKKEEEQE